VSRLLLRAELFFRNRLPLLDGFLLSFFPPRAHGNRVLVVRLDAIGDFVIWLDAARALVRYYHLKGYSVVLLGNKAWASWAREMGVADEVWEIDVIQFIQSSKYFTYRWQWLKKIRKAGFEIAIQPAYSRVILTGDTLVRASGAVERIGSAGDESNITPQSKSWSDRWYTRLIPATSTQLMELKRNAEFMRGLGFTEFKSRLPTIPQTSSEQTNWLPQQPYAVLAPAANWVGREWPIDNFIEIGRRLAKVGLHIAVVGAAADRESIGGLIESLPRESVDLVGKTTLSELAEVLRRATIVVTNETGAVHIGSAVDAPVVCILGGGHFGRFVPYEIDAYDENRNLPIVVTTSMTCFGCNWKCIYPHQNAAAVKCIQDISVDMVWKAVEIVLAKRDDKMSA